MLIEQKMKGKSLRDVAPNLNISPSTLSRLLHGKTPDLETFLAVCHWLEVSPLTVLLKDGKPMDHLTQGGTLEGPTLTLKLREPLPPEQHTATRLALQQLDVMWNVREKQG